MFVAGEAGEGHDEAGEAEEGEVAHDESDEKETVLGIDVESPATVAAAVALSLVLAVLLWACCAFWGFAVNATDDEVTLRWEGPPP